MATGSLERRAQPCRSSQAVYQTHQHGENSVTAEQPARPGLVQSDLSEGAQLLAGCKSCRDLGSAGRASSHQGQQGEPVHSNQVECLQSRHCDQIISGTSALQCTSLRVSCQPSRFGESVGRGDVEVLQGWLFWKPVPASFGQSCVGYSSAESWATST